jgi:uncharacterized membrane protein
MGAAYLAMGIFLMSTAFYLAGQTKLVGLGWFAAILGFANLVVAVVFTRHEEKEARHKDEAALNVLVSIADRLGVDMESLEKTLGHLGYRRTGRASNDSDRTNKS